MRAALLILVVVILGGVAVWLGLGTGDVAPITDAGGGVTVPPRVEHAATVEAPAGVPRAVATRTEAVAVAPEDLADAPTACLLVTDHEGGRPIAGASIRRMQGGAVIGFTDDRGLAELPLEDREQLAVIADDYLLRMAPTHLGSTATEPQRIALVRDRWSVVRRFEFRSGIDGSVVDEVFARIGQANFPEWEAPATTDEVVNRAWAEHSRLAATAVCADLPIYQGQDRIFRIENGGEVRFAGPGDYVFEIAAASGLVNNDVVKVTRDAGAPRKTVRIELVRGSYVIGTVTSSSSQPLSGAAVTRQGGDPLGLVCTTSEDGAFAFGPLGAGEVTLLVRHPDHEPIAFGPVSTQLSQARITLQELPRSTLRGRVRRRPGLEPIGGAAVSWAATANPPITAVTAADGTFQLAATGEVAGRLLVSAPGCIPLAELVAPGSPYQEYDVLPASTAERLSKKLTAVLSGVVLDAASRPAASTAVRWIPDHPAAGGVPSRRAISGNTLSLSLTTTTRADGSFELETDQLGSGTLALVGRDFEKNGVATQAIAGTTKDGHRLRQP